MKKGAPASSEKERKSVHQPGSVFKQPSPQRKLTHSAPICYLYGRESRRDPATPRGRMSPSIITQFNAMRQKLVDTVDLLSYRVEETFEYGSAGNLAKLTGLRRILRSIDSERGDVIVVASADRLCRFDSVADRELLFKHQILIVDKNIFYKGEPEIRQEIEALFDAAVAERLRISERVIKRFDHFRKYNLKVQAPFGYRFNREHTVLHQDPLRFPILRALLRFLTDDQTTVMWRLGVDVWDVAAQILKGLGYPYKLNHDWSRPIVLKLYNTNEDLGLNDWYKRYSHKCLRCPVGYDMYREDEMSRLNVLICQTCEAALTQQSVDVRHTVEFVALPAPVSPGPNDPRVLAYLQYARQVLGAVPLPAAIEAAETQPATADPVMDELADNLEAVTTFATTATPELPPLEDPDAADAAAYDTPDEYDTVVAIDEEAMEA